MSEKKLIHWIIRWCTHPGMYLAGPSDKGEPDISNLLLLVHGYFAGAEHLAETGYMDTVSEWKQFRGWLEQQRPRYFREGTVWLGDVVLEEAGGNHWRAAEEFKRLAEEYLRTQAPAPG